MDTELDGRVRDLEAAVEGLEEGTRAAVLGAVAGLLEACLPPADLFGERRPSAQGVPDVQALQTVVNRLRDAAARAGGS